MGTTGEQEFDGFISARESDRHVSLRIIAELADYTNVSGPSGKAQINVAEQQHCKDVDRNHMLAAKKLITGAKFVLILLGPRRLVPPPEKLREHCYQLEEIEGTYRELENKADGVEPFGVFPVLLQDEDGKPTRDDYRRELKQDGYGAAYIDALLSDSSLCFLRGYNKRKSAVYRNDLAALVTKIYLYISRNFDDEPEGICDSGKGRIGKDDDDEEITGSYGEDAHARFKALELAYLRKAANGWRLGRIGVDDERRKKGSGSDFNSAFRFQPHRFVEFRAYDGKPSNARPVSEWLFRPQERPLLLLGEGGAGKTTVLAAAACGFASTREADLRKYCDKIAGGRWAETARRALDDLPEYTPVLVRCAEICEAVKHAPGDTDALLDALLSHIRHVIGENAGEAVSWPTREAFRAHLLKKPYVLMFDGLDEVSDREHAEKLYEAASGLAITLSKDTRVIFSCRPNHGMVLHAVELTLEMPLESWDSIEKFIDRFAEDDDKGALRIKAAARKLWGTGDGRNAPLKTPLLLNAFCCIVDESREETSGYTVDFCQEIVGYFLRDRTFPRLAAAVEDPAEDMAAVARDALRRIAYAIVEQEWHAIGASRARQILASGGEIKPVDEKRAGAILRELSLQTNLLRADGESYRFVNAGLLCEYLAGEHMAALDWGDLIGDGGKLHDASWRTAIRFAHAIKYKNIGADDDAAFAGPRKLLDRARAAQDGEEAWLFAHNALEMIAERPPTLGLDGKASRAFSAIIDCAVAVYRARFDQWDARRRSAFVDLLCQCGRQGTAIETRAAIDGVFEALLPSRQRWTAAGGAAKRLQVADIPVLVADYRAFLEDPSRDEFWADAAGPAERVFISETQGGSRDDIRRRDGWVAQMERPGAPVTSITWHEAVAYCRWLEARLRGRPGGIGVDETIRMPSKSEWIALMQWLADGHEYPWRGASPAEDPGRVNWDGAKVARASAPGVFEATGMPTIYDFGSNVCSWLAADDAAFAWPPRSADGIGFGGGAWTDKEAGWMGADISPYGALPDERRVKVGLRLVRAPKAGAGK